MLAPRAAWAQGNSVPLDQVARGSVKVNGVLSEWAGALTPLTQRVSGSPGQGADLTVRASLAYDDDALYLAADVTDDKLVRTAAYGPNEDRLSLTIAFPDEKGGFTPVEVDLFAGDPGNVAGAVVLHGGGKIAGAQIVEAPGQGKGSLTVEAKIPWGAFAPAARVRCGLRGAIRYHDADGPSVEGVVGTSAEAQGARMPPLPIDAERAIVETFAREKGLTGLPEVSVIADLAGDEQREHLMLWGQYVLVAGPRFRDGKQFYFNDLGVERGAVPLLEARDLAGKGKSQIVLRRRRGTPSKYREALEVFSLGEGGLEPLFQHEIAVATDGGQVVATYKLEPGKIEIAVGQATGLTQASYKEPPETSFDGVLLPWGTTQRQFYQWDGSRFAKVREESKPAGDAGGKPGTTTGTASTTSSSATPAPPPPRAPTADELQEQVLALYRRDRKLGPKDRPLFDLVTNVAEDERLERVLVFGRDLVVVGKGFLGGQGYAAMGVGFAEGRDVSHVTTRDLDGDGRAEIVVRGVQHVAAPKELGKGTLDRELLVVYTVREGKIVRVLAAETAVSMGDRRVSSTVSMSPGQRGVDVVLGPGHAVGWDAKSFPFRQETAPQNGVEPLVLPWTPDPVRLRWVGAGYTR